MIIEVMVHGVERHINESVFSLIEELYAVFAR